MRIMRTGLFSLWVTLLALLVAGGCGGGESKSAAITGTDTEFAQKVFTMLAAGDMAVQDSIDWDNFKVAGQDTGVVYRGMPNDAAKAEFRKGFIPSFSKSFSQSGATASMLTNWRVQSQDATKVTVQADSKQRPLILVITRVGGERKVSELQLG